MLKLIASNRGADLGVRHVLVVDRESNHLRVGERLDEIDLGGWRWHCHLWKVPEMRPCRSVLENNPIGEASPENER